MATVKSWQARGLKSPRPQALSLPRTAHGALSEGLPLSWWGVEGSWPRSPYSGALNLTKALWATKAHWLSDSGQPRVGGQLWYWALLP